MARRKIVVIDCETDPFEYGTDIQPFIWGAVEENGDRHLFYETKDLIDFLKPNKFIVYAHNGGKFDYHFLLDYIEAFEPVMIINGRLAKFKIGQCEFRDSYNIFPLPLAAYKKIEFDYSKMKRENRDKHMKEIIDYLFADCDYLLEIVLNFIDGFGLNLTLAGSAMKQWNKLNDAPAPQTSEEYYREFSPYYYGGRVQPFVTGIFKGDHKIYDINSAYPYAMLNPHPYGGVWERLSGYDNEPIVGMNFYKIIGESIGILPFRDENSLIFPNDKEYRTFYISGHELILYKKYTNKFEILEVRNCLSFTDFKEYIYKWYELKNQSPKGSTDYIFAKLMMNSLYGKFGANPDKYKEFEVIPNDCVLAHEADTGADFAGMLGDKALMSLPLPDTKKRYYDVATAASITGFVRAYLYESILKIQESGSQVLYCDTDSVIIKGNADALDIGDELGQWDCEGEFDSVAIAGKKLYSLRCTNGKFKTASKGVRLTPKEIYSVANGNEETWKNIAPTFSLKRGTFYQQRRIKKLA